MLVEQKSGVADKGRRKRDSDVAEGKRDFGVDVSSLKWGRGNGKEVVYSIRVVDYVR